MKLVHPDFYLPIVFSEDGVFVLVLENERDFSSFVYDIYKQINGEEEGWVLSHNNTELKMSKCCELLFDPFSTELNQRKLLNALYGQLEEEIMSSEKLLKWNQAHAFMTELMDDFTSDLEFSVNHKLDIDVKDFFKIMNLQFDYEQTSILEKVIDYMNLSKEVCGTEVFVLVNFKSYFSSKQLLYLYEQAIYKKYTILLVESREKERLKYEKCVVIDIDGCVIE